MTIFLTSDLHLSHTRCAVQFRGFDSVEEHDEAIIDNWNATVGPHDAVIILGDAVMGKFVETVHLLGRLRGSNIYLIPGNHDRCHPSYDKRPHKREEWRRMYEGYVTVLPLQVPLWGFLLCHFPAAGDHTPEERYPEYRPVLADDQWQLCGHVHDAWDVRDRQINVGVDVRGFAPVAIEDLMQIRAITSPLSPPSL